MEGCAFGFRTDLPPGARGQRLEDRNGRPVGRDSYPLTFRQDSTATCWIGAWCEEGRWFLRKRVQADHAVFAGKWLKNIKEQQAV